jgi:hypothetical protein
MPLDFRLASLMNAVKQDWKELETKEEGGALVIRVKEPETLDDYRPVSTEKKPKNVAARLGFGPSSKRYPGLRF